jgi:paraquat-inducible protein A
MGLLLAVLLALAPMLFVFGVTLPLVTFEKLYFFEDNPSLIGMINSLWINGEFGLVVLVGLFSIVFPIVKMIAILSEALAVEGAFQGAMARMVPILSKWSMMDVMLVAIVVVAAKTTGFANAFAEPGLWCYASSALAMSVAQWLVRRRNTKSL